MFFTRYWRDKVESLERRVVELEAAQRAYQGYASSLLSTLQSAQKSFDILARQYNDGLERAREIQEKAEEALQNPAWSATPLYATEEEEDLQWQLDSGVLDPQEYENALERAGLLNK